MDGSRQSVALAAALSASGLALLASAASAQEAAPAPAPAPDTSVYTLFNPVPDNQLGPICTDRPTKSNGPCSVPAGHLQIESDIVSASFQRQGGVTTDTYVFADPNFKIGLTKTFDAELAFTPVETIVTHDHGADSTLTGFGDVVARVKWNVVGADGGDFSIALSPFVKLPTARRGIGNGVVEEGLLIPLTYNLPAGWQFGFNGEIDALKNANDDGRHANYTAIFSLAHPLTKTLTGSAEIWTNVDAEAGQVVREQSFDLSFAWIPAAMQKFQLDGGLNLGLNKATPGAQFYLGVSRLF
jgi:hypothetical protein